MENGLTGLIILAFRSMTITGLGLLLWGFYPGFMILDRWLRTMPMAKVERLIHFRGKGIPGNPNRLHLHSRVCPWTFPKRLAKSTLLGKKMFEFRKRSCHLRYSLWQCSGKGPWMRICDAGAFFQCSFLKAIDPSTWKTPIVSHDEYELIQKV